MRLEFDKGTIAVDGEYNLPHTTWDDRTGNNRALGLRYRDLIDYVDRSGITVDDNVLDLVPTPDLSTSIDLRPYQQEALDRWLTDYRGVVVLPTGAGKTYVGMQAIARVNAPTFVVVPTLDLVDQWIDELDAFEIAIGEYTGREKQIEPITVATYDSA